MIAALFVRRYSIYKTLGVDCWDEDRDARNFTGPGPVVCHPPCGQWGRLRAFAHQDLAVKALAVKAVEFVRNFGGVLEHPATSSLWDYCGLPKPNCATRGHEFSIAVPQLWFGHKAEKKTWLYFSGLTPNELPSINLSLREPTHCVDSSMRRGQGLKYLSKKDREATPREFASWLIEAASRCQPKEVQA